MKQPWLYQYAACPLLQPAPVMFVHHAQLLPPPEAGKWLTFSSKSIELRERGVTMAPWPAASGRSAATTSPSPAPSRRSILFAAIM
eukprot:COSAG01_NODE_782_length_13631_cov_73.763450_16_plen_86_part_00